MPDLDICVCLYLLYRFDFRTGDATSVLDRTLFEFVVGSEHFSDLQVHILYRQVYSQGSQNTDNLVYTREKPHRFLPPSLNQTVELAVPFELLTEGFWQEPVG